MCDDARSERRLRTGVLPGCLNTSSNAQRCNRFKAGWTPWPPTLAVLSRRFIGCKGVGPAITFRGRARALLLFPLSLARARLAKGDSDDRSGCLTIRLVVTQSLTSRSSAQLPCSAGKKGILSFPVPASGSEACHVSRAARVLSEVPAQRSRNLFSGSGSGIQTTGNSGFGEFAWPSSVGAVDVSSPLDYPPKVPSGYSA